MVLIKHNECICIFKNGKKCVFVLLKLHFFLILEHCVLLQINFSSQTDKSRQETRDLPRVFLHIVQKIISFPIQLSIGTIALVGSRNLPYRHWRNVLYKRDVLLCSPIKRGHIPKRRQYYPSQYYSWLRRSLEEGRLLSLSAFESFKSRQQGRDTVSSPCFRPDSSRASAYCRQTSHKLARKPVQQFEK